MTDDRHLKAAALLADGHTQVEAAEEVGVSPRTVRRWRNSGKLEGLVEADTGADTDATEPDGPDTVDLNGRPASNGRTGNPPTLSEARRRKTLALAERREIEAAKMRGDLIHIDFMRDALLRLKAAVRAAPKAVLPEITEAMGVETREAFPILDEVSGRILDHVEADFMKWLEEGADDG